MMKNLATTDARRASSFSRLLIFYFFSTTLASIAFTIQDSLILGGPAPFHVSFIPFGFPYIYPSLLTTMLSVWLMAHFIDKRPLVSVGLKIDWFALVQGCAGTLAGILCKALIMYAIIYFQIGQRPRWPFFAPISDLAQFLLGALPFLLASMTEELFFRGYLLQTLLEGIGILPAVLVSSAVFGLIHYDLGGWMYILNAGLIGVLLALAYLKTRSLWSPIGLHFGFNLIGGYWGLQGEPTPAFTTMKPELLSLGNPIYTLGIIAVILIFLILPVSPRSDMQALWGEYIHPAPFPPWWKGAGPTRENSDNPPQVDLSLQHPDKDQDSKDV